MRPKCAWLAGLLAAMPILGLAAQTAPTDGQPSEKTATEETVDLGRNEEHRLTVPVTVGDNGPYDFVIDTGAERTVIADSLARRLALEPGSNITLYSMGSVNVVPTVIVPSLGVNQKQRVTGIEAPALNEAHLGAKGMLGVDSLQDQRVTLDFQRRKMTVVPSEDSRNRSSENMIVVTARSRFGRLVLVDARLDGQKVWVVIDTGSDVTVGNSVLRAKLEKRKRYRNPVPIRITSVTGEAISADYVKTSELMLGGLAVWDMPIAFADVPPFAKLDLEDKPALLLGMDALSAFKSVSVDFAQRKVRFQIRDTPGIKTRIAGR